MAAAAPQLPRLTTLLDRSKGAPLPLPSRLREAYDGALAFRDSGPIQVFANFVTTLDGLVSYGIPGKAHAAVISRREPADRFVMGLLRACADVVVSGAGTLRAEARSTWTPDQIFPPAASLYRELRRTLGRPERVSVAILTASGEVDVSLPVFNSSDVDVLLVTTTRGAERLLSRQTGHRVQSAGDDPSMREMLQALTAATRARLVLSEAGPMLFGRMLAERAVDELFLTVAPQVGGRSAERRGLSLVEPQAFAPEDAPWGDLVSVKLAGDFLLLRYVLGGGPR